MSYLDGYNRVMHSAGFTKQAFARPALQRIGRSFKSLSPKSEASQTLRSTMGQSKDYGAAGMWGSSRRLAGRGLKDYGREIAPAAGIMGAGALGAGAVGAGIYGAGKRRGRQEQPQQRPTPLN